jgi:prolyl oligopeptidase
VQAPTAGGSVAWLHDGSGFWYTRYPGAERAESDRRFHQQVYFHRPGGDWRADPLVLGTRDGLPRIAMTVLDSLHLRGQALAQVANGDGGDYAHYILTPDKAVRLSEFADRIITVAAAPDGALYALSRAGALNGKVLRLPPPFAPLSLPRAAVIVPESDTAIEFVTVTPTHLLVTDIIGGPNRVRVFDHAGRPGAPLPIPGMAAVRDIAPLPDGGAIFRLSEYLRPSRQMRWDGARSLVEPLNFPDTVPYGFDDAEVVREFARSKDGTRVPVDIVRRRGVPLDGSLPTILYGYGGYGENQKPYFAGAFVRLWLDAGGVFATAIIRGGAEFGEQWHLDGMLTKKQNVFDDFSAAARHLIERRYTSPAGLGLLGESNGGLLVGAVLTQHPELARAAVARVGIFDMLRVELEPNGEFNVTEFGTVENPAQFQALHAYSPYHRLRPGMRYPATLLTAGENDGRVDASHARKFAAALQAATGSGAPVLLRTSASGHGTDSPTSEMIAENTDILAFLVDQLGAAWPAPARAGALQDGPTAR